MSKFIEERLKLVRSLAEKADPFIKPRLLALADRYERQLSPTVPPPAVREIRMETGVGQALRRGLFSDFIPSNDAGDCALAAHEVSKS